MFFFLMYIFYIMLSKHISSIFSIKAIRYNTTKQHNQSYLSPSFVITKPKSMYQMRITSKSKTHKVRNKNISYISFIRKTIQSMSKNITSKP
ncbi:hypothetical protein AAZX31_17G172600 [Glycine max]